MNIKPGLRVHTPHGVGTVIRFEHIEHVNKPIIYTDIYIPRDRIDVELDNRDNWTIIQGCGNPHYVLRDLTELEETQP